MSQHAPTVTASFGNANFTWQRFLESAELFLRAETGGALAPGIKVSARFEGGGETNDPTRLASLSEPVRTDRLQRRLKLLLEASQCRCLVPFTVTVDSLPREEIVGQYRQSLDFQRYLAGQREMSLSHELLALNLEGTWALEVYQERLSFDSACEALPTGGELIDDNDGRTGGFIFLVAPDRSFLAYSDDEFDTPTAMGRDSLAFPSSPGDFIERFWDEINETLPDPLINRDRDFQDHDLECFALDDLAALVHDAAVSACAGLGGESTTPPRVEFYAATPDEPAHFAEIPPGSNVALLQEVEQLVQTFHAPTGWSWEYNDGIGNHLSGHSRCPVHICSVEIGSLSAHERLAARARLETSLTELRRRAENQPSSMRP